MSALKDEKKIVSVLWDNNWKPIAQPIGLPAHICGIARKVDCQPLLARRLFAEAFANVDFDDDREYRLVSVISNYEVCIPAQLQRAGSVVILENDTVFKIHKGKKKKKEVLKTIAPRVHVANRIYHVPNSLSYDE